MNKSKNYRHLAGALIGVTSALCLSSGNARAEDFTNPAVSTYWGESWTDATGLYTSPDPTKTTVPVGGPLIASIPTDGSLTSPDNEVTNYVRTGDFVNPLASTYYGGSLLGNISSQTGLTSTFSLNNNAVAPATQFQASQFVGEGTGPQMTAPIDANDPSGYTYNSGTPTPSLRFVFTGGTADVNADGAGDMEPNEWWSATSSVSATSMINGQNVTLDAVFDPSQWTNVDGKAGNDPLVAGQFDEALGDVTRLGLSFGSGFFYSDGFSFNTGGVASLNISNIDSVPEPASLSLLGVGTLALLRRRRRSHE